MVMRTGSGPCEWRGGRAESLPIVPDWHVWLPPFPCADATPLLERAVVVVSSRWLGRLWRVSVGPLLLISGANAAECCTAHCGGIHG